MDQSQKGHFIKRALKIRAIDDFSPKIQNVEFSGFKGRTK